MSLGSSYYIRNKSEFIYDKQNFLNGAFGKVLDEFDGYVSSSDVPSLKINTKKVNPKYLISFFSRKNYYKKFEALASGTGSMYT